ncbi:MAG: hypothetical protein GKS06_11800 [Acidobacteria bacterium]|nr:hypothetical protein [Acidobacteriota bacterium]
MNRPVSLRTAACVVMVLALAACRNADLLKPESERAAAATSDGADERAFTRIGEEDPGPLTSEVAYDWFDRIGEAGGQERLGLIDEFLEAFPEAGRIAVVHEMQAEALAAEQRLGEASEAYERALVLTRTDITGMPLSTELPLQLARTRLSSGAVDSGIDWLLRTSIADQSDGVMLALQWAYATHASGDDPFDGWWYNGIADVAPGAPTFRLPGLLTEDVGVAPDAGLTLVNFWSPT